MEKIKQNSNALIRMEEEYSRLGDVVGGFKAAVSREVRRRVVQTNPRTRIWHRNYEMIVRTPEAEKKPVDTSE